MSPRSVATFVFALFLLVGGSVAGALASPGPSAVIVVADASFGSPPSGQIPILYNDHHVYARPDVLRANRVLAALVKGGTILVPLRSMFEDMGATVSYDAATQSFTIEKSGASIKLALGKKEAVINGEARPLDQGPIMYHGVALVPIRVISETMGAYVEWLPSQRIAIVRYIPPTPPPTPVPTPPPTPVPTPVPTPKPPPVKQYNGFLQGAFAWGKNYNEFAQGAYCRTGTYVWSGAYMLHDLALKVDFREDQYVTNAGLGDRFGNVYTVFGTIDGGFWFTPVFQARQTTMDARLEYLIARPRIYIAGSYFRATTNYGYPNLYAGGFGIEKLPDLRDGLSIFGNFFYYPGASGNYTVVQPSSSNAGKTYKQQYNIDKYDIGLDLAFHNFPVYITGGWSGDYYAVKQNAPINQTHSGPYVGLGVRF